MKTGQLKISKLSEKPFIEAVIHESIHAIRSIFPESYNNMANLVFEVLSMDTSAMSSAWRYTASIYSDQLLDKDGNLNRDLVNEELVANVMSKMLFSEDYVNELAGVNRGLVQRVLDAIKDFFDKVFNRYKRTPFISIEMEDAMKLLNKEVKSFKKMYTDALGATRKLKTDKGKASEVGGVMYAKSNVYDYTKSFAEQLDDFDNIPENDSIFFCPSNLGGWLSTFTEGLSEVSMMITRKRMM